MVLTALNFEMRVCVISGVIKDSKVLQALSASFSVSFMFATLNGLLLCQDLVLSSVTTEV